MRINDKPRPDRGAPAIRLHQTAAGAPRKPRWHSHQRGQSRRNQAVLRQLDFVAVMTGTATVDDQKVANSIKRQQRVMPDTGGVIDPLVTTSEEDAEVFCRRRLTGRRYDDQIRSAGHRHESLAALGGALHHLDRKGQLPRLAAEDRDNDLAVRTRLDFCQVVVTLGVATVDREMIRRFGGTCLLYTSRCV